MPLPITPEEWVIYYVRVPNSIDLTKPPRVLISICFSVHISFFVLTFYQPNKIFSSYLVGIVDKLLPTIFSIPSILDKFISTGDNLSPLHFYLPPFKREIFFSAFLHLYKPRTISYCFVVSSLIFDFNNLICSSRSEQKPCIVLLFSTTSKYNTLLIHSFFRFLYSSSSSESCQIVLISFSPSETAIGVKKIKKSQVTRIRITIRISFICSFIRFITVD